MLEDNIKSLIKILEESKVELKVTKIGEKPSYVLGKDGKKKDNI